MAGTMGTRLSDCRLFFHEFLTNYRTTGAVLPSGRFLASALARFVRDGNGSGPRRVLEVGPGTGAVTPRIIAALGPEDTLDLVELNESFVRHLRQRFEDDPAFQPGASRARVLHCPVEELPEGTRYHAIVSGLPLNNFAVEEVRGILEVFRRLLEPGGTLSFFEYIALRRLKGMVSRGDERARLRGIGEVTGGLLAQHEVRRDWVWPNVPPAWVHHVRF
jgi:phosphatidylethanolamine/phosphatidyl-N-methylethanolamine N-methyltransferase